MNLATLRPHTIVRCHFTITIILALLQYIWVELKGLSFECARVLV
jgi:hypothetical protein